MPTHLPIWFHGSIPLESITRALAGEGIHVRSDANGKMIAEQVPRFIRRDEPEDKVLRLPTRLRKVRS